MSLQELTSRDAVIDAVQQCDVIDLETSVPGFGPARDYVLEVDGKHYHAKNVAGVAYGVQHPDRGTLPASKFGKNSADTARLLERLGFMITTTAKLWPPNLGDEYPSRTAVYDAYGGDKVAGIIRFPRDEVVNAFSDEEGPYADEPPNPLKPFEYRGEGRYGNQLLTIKGNKRLDRARRERRAVRYWYRPAGGTFKFAMWVAVLSRAQVWSLDDNKKLRLEYTFQMMAVPGPELDTWPPHVDDLIDDKKIEDTPPPTPPAQGATKNDRRKTYQDYLQGIGETPDTGSTKNEPTKRTRNVYPRSRRVRDAVLIRADGWCENDSCTGMPPDTTPSGEAILEVDHVDDLALKGLDYPEVMIALCPNCHAAKTRGLNRAALKRHFRARAAELHRKAAQSSK
ncbi:hypothetical protein [Amycolatopsis sp. cmx-11-12]|uniref:hypothetical protein n=1 Tax=Amycolatopsis sp. cmx-11-12 TaxID=2785795 RepID=UPI003916D70D